MENNIKGNTTFWTEINSYKIQVPYYQRDYAQGRTDGGRIDNIRKVFVEELYQAIKEERQCHLGLVFGSYDTDNSTFIAVDGQQRLTTVFLLHWYVAWKEDKLNDYQKLSINFSWDTRSYSSQFVELLFKINRIDNVIDAIKTNCNYFSIWENDPTVKGMLTMLEEIERQYSEVEGGLCQKLFSNDCKIRYDILKLEKDSDGKTYLKMNSRGRSLTTFELFKSKFIDEYKPSFANKFDGTWLNFMLEMSKDDNENFADPDISYMNFINEYTYMILSLRNNDDSDKEYKHFIDAKMKDNLPDVPFISFEKYKPAFENINSFEKFFDWICPNYETIKSIDEELRFPDSKFFADEIIKSSNPHFSHRTKLFSLHKYAELTEYAPVDKELYKRWNRVFRNLVANSEIDGNNFGKICKTINQVANAHIYLYLANGGKLNTFDNDQIEEEIAKAKQIITGGSEWESKIIEAEKYAFFKGAIRFLFQNAEGKVMEDSWKLFDNKWANAKEYFDENGVKKDTSYRDEALLMKSLLANCDNFWGKIWWHFEFSNDAIQWKRILTSGNWRNAVDTIMSKEVTTETTKDYVNNTKDVLIKNIIDDGLMDYVCDKMSGARLRSTYHGYHAIWISRYPASQVVLNPILAQLNVYYSSDNVIETCRYYKCKDKNVDFKYGGYYFRWFGNSNDKELDVYLMEENWKDYKKRTNPTTEKNTDEDTYYCFRVTKEMESDTNLSLFMKQLDCLIAQAFSDTDKSVCLECKEKICESTLEE